jgi:phage-related protein
VEKTFKFSGELKKMVEGIFLKKITSLEELSNQEWLKGEVY